MRRKGRDYEHKYFLSPDYQRIRRELIGSVVILAGLFITGTIWFWLVDKWPFLDAAYMTMITLSTVGFGEIRPLKPHSRLFTMVLIVAGVVTIGYMVNRFTEAIIQGYFQEGIRLRQKRKVIDKLSGHYIVCGFGRMGTVVAQEFAAEGIPFIVIDSEKEEVERATQMGYLAIQGDATLDEYLLLARIDTAACIIAALSSDADNLYTVISAKTLNPNIRAIARASTEEAVKKLQRAGADAVVSPYITGGKRLAAAALRPQVMDFVDGIISGTEKSFYLEEFRLQEDDCPFIGQSLMEAGLRAKTGALVVAIRRRNGILIAGPTGGTILEAGDTLICMGTAEQLRALNQLLSTGVSIYTPAFPRIPRKKDIPASES